MHIAVIGCGQLSRMLALAGIPMGFRFSFLADEPGQDTRCIEQLGDIVHWEPGLSPAALYDLLGRPDVVTAEKEQLDVALLQSLQPFCAVHPNPESFAQLQDRSKEKRLLDQLEIPTAPYVSGQDAAAAVAALSLPLVAKSCRGGYDGKNQAIMKTPQDAEDFDAKGQSSHYIIEKWIPFEREVSIVSARDRTGNIAHYPLTENVHDQGILKQSIAPARGLSEATTASARQYIAKIMQAYDYVGVMAVEFFVVNGDLLVNEVAPRVHNSGHWTQSGCTTSQFENHVRAIAGLALGNTENHGVTGMVNLIGTGVPTTTACSANSTLHWYNKQERPGRKLGHVNFIGASYDELEQSIHAFWRDALPGSPDGKQ